ncbi:Zinc finger with UFM1-specific peptidase domain protein [Bagarius yarrelli]|uniref:Zinc finger-containing ubiquitin peptidase 1 n=1 Tax=Bagarius yarrelli TaxID=175774 RepID=A0A556U6F5_BAGYA|nr:Zinc finger with UFM1-specific peptidase domain protein [Bagarius yarrelli]
MPVCDICSEELSCESELKTHLLLTHLENKVTCPLCSLSGVSYDELNFHINTAHSETSSGHAPATGDPRQPEATVVSSVSRSPETLNMAKKPSRRPAEETKRQDEQQEKKRNQLMEPFAIKHRRLSFQSKGRTFSCPVCELVYTDCFMLQEHVELHLQDRAVPDVDLYADLQLAQQLQQEDERQRKEEEVKREAEEFTKLQRAVSRGHMTPTEYHLKRVEMIETLAAGLDDGQSKTAGLLSALYHFYQCERQEGTRVWLCSESEHFSSSDGDRGWGCGYRNFQMLLSSLQRLEQYNTLHTLPESFPSIPRVQTLIEAAWAEGIDPQGASQFNGRLKGTRAWIGATEIYSVLTYLKLRARIVDFHQPTGPGGTHPRLFQWVKNYFSIPSSTGHSRTVVGVEERRNGSICLVLFDPGCPPAEMRKLLSPNSSSGNFNRLRKFPAHLKHQQYQVVVVGGVLSEEEKQERVINSRTLQAERIP